MNAKPKGSSNKGKKRGKAWWSRFLEWLARPEVVSSRSGCMT